MKKLFCLLCFGAFVNAQDLSKNAIGLRFGDNDGFGTELSYQRAFSDANRLELDFGWRDNNNFSAVKLAGLYQWVWNIDGGFNWYAGGGGGVGSWKGKDYRVGNNEFKGESNTVLFLAGDIGIEYHFDFPLQIALDLRPEFYLNDGIEDDFGPDFGISFRYKF